MERSDDQIFQRIKGKMYTVKVTSRFSSAHNLRGYKGKCEELHGHNWLVEVAASRGDLDNIGMVTDFKELKAILEEVLSELDHKHLNEIEYFSKVNPTSENIAKFIYDSLIKERPDISYVTVWETDTSSATYSK